MVRLGSCGAAGSVGITAAYHRLGPETRKPREAEADDQLGICQGRLVYVQIEHGYD